MRCETFPPRWQKLLLIALFLGVAMTTGMAQVLQTAKKTAVGIIAYRSSPGGLDEYAEAVYFRAVTMEPFWAAIDVGGIKPLSVGRDCVAATVRFDEALTIDLVDGSGRAVLVKTRDELVAMTKQCPKSEALARPVITALESSIAKMDNGEVRRNGQWVNVVAENKAKQAQFDQRLKRLANLKNAAPGRFLLKETVEQAIQRFGAPTVNQNNRLFFNDRDYLFMEHFLDGKTVFIKVAHQDHSPFANEEIDALLKLADTEWRMTENGGTWKTWKLPDASEASYNLAAKELVFYTPEWTVYTKSLKDAQQQASASPHAPREATRHQVILEARSIGEKEWPGNYESQLRRIEEIVIGWQKVTAMEHSKLSDESQKLLSTAISNAEDRWGWDYSKVASEMSKQIDNLGPEEKENQ
jgi:hypothetical protein